MQVLLRLSSFFRLPVKFFRVFVWEPVPVLDVRSGNPETSPHNMKLYVDMVSAPCRAVALFCELNDIAYEKKQVKIARGETRSAEFQCAQPLHQLELA